MPNPASPHHFPTQVAAVAFLNAQGFKLSKSKFNAAVKSGEITCDSTGQFFDEDLRAYARADAAPPPRATQRPKSAPVVTPPGYVRTQKAAVAFLQAHGWTHSQSKFNVDYNAGLVPCEQKGLFREEDLLAYARGDTLPPPPPKPEPITEGPPTDLINHPEEPYAVDPEAPELPQGFKEVALGIMADGVINESEAQMLALWLSKRPDAGGYAIKKLRSRLEEVLRDEQFDCRAGKALFQTLKGLLTGFLPQWMHDVELPGSTIDHKGRIASELILTPEIPGLYDKPHYIDLTATFCFTGIFAYGERCDVEAAAEAHGGSTSGHPVKSRPCYVVVGSVASPDWAHGHYGRKVEQAMRFREEGAPVQIISEDTWAAALS